MLTTTINFVLAWLVINAIDVLEARALWLRILLALGIAATTWSLARLAEREANEAIDALPVD